ncbi:LuxR C-terminal-related transcriptional regulator [Rhodococcus sp. SORGH_AS_0301]|uniref:ATP-binding protein n=1 Tax=Rhodococcus sp. SORGH_AS_0301 TaxID=3041780 RepID=UPI0027883619|nr:LuxR C-terminal-related transcriptional regulator [Rhodococcus sp. SORGH_AS_0301]MDQ1178614.1 putative ATPase/DNA-binding CsgD family transcriptional regulator [Rhodococcus sp. SORGH_AS_0301]
MTHRQSLTTFIGRRREINHARARMQESRLVTLVGPGGVGKTRMAEEIASRSARAFRDSALWVDLAAVRDPEALPAAAAAALGVTDQSNRAVIARIADHLRDRSMMIVLDNCEHLLEAASDFVSTVLDNDPGVRVLATSRERLGVGGEVIFEVPPLTTPETAIGRRAGDLATYESVTLLVERAHAVVPNFVMTDENAPAVAQLCIQLDGIPLAIELAAVRLRSLSPEQLVQRLDDRFALLSTGSRTDLPRQQTLRALIDWSYDLCSTEERKLWSRLSVFPGGFDLDAAEAICSDQDDARQVVDVLDQLVAKSLVRVDRSGSSLRFSQLMTVREYGHELLDTSGEKEAVLRGHRDHYLSRAEDYAADWFSPRQSLLLARWRTDHANFIAALDWSLRERHLDEAARFAVALRYHWIAGGNLADGRIRLERLLDRLPVTDVARGNVLWVAAWTALIQGDRAGAAQHLDACNTTARREDDRRLQAHHDHWAALHALFSGRLGDAIPLFNRAVEVHGEFGDSAATLTAQFQLGMAHVYAGDFESALATSSDVVDVADTYGEQWNKAYALWVSSIAHYHRGDLDAAKTAAQRALRIQRDFQDKICTALSIELLAWVASAENKKARATELFTAAGTVWSLLGTSVSAFGPHIQADSDEAFRRLRRTAPAATGHDSEGPSSRMTIGDAVDLALEIAAPTVPADAERGTHLLTSRELEVAELVAQGLSNRVIAEKLVVSRRTVDGHVERILNKLGVNSRTQVVAWLSARNCRN